jgi:hypothetical protein
MKPATVHATFKTPNGEITARAHWIIERRGDVPVARSSAIAHMTDVHVHGDWTVILASTDERIEWRHEGAIVGAPFDHQLPSELRTELLRTARVMLAWWTS